MIDLYTWTTPNGRKVSIMLEECGLPYNVHKIDIGNGDQFTPQFLAINPNGKIPAIIDSNGPDKRPITLFESGAILVYLAQHYQKFLPPDWGQLYHVFQWLMFQMGGVGPMFGQTHHFLRAAKEEVPYAIERYKKETDRLYGVMDKQLATSKFIACNQYSIADVAIFPWLRNWENHGIDWADYPHLKAWFDLVGARPAVQRGVKVLADLRRTITGDKEREILFGKTQYSQR